MSDGAQVSDLPFGAKHSSPESLPQLYAAFLAEAHRVLRTSGRASILTGSVRLSACGYLAAITDSIFRQEELMSSLLRDSPLWELTSSHYIALGTRASFLYVLRATSTKT